MFATSNSLSLAQFFQHVGGSDAGLIVVAHTLASCDMTNRSDRGAAHLSDPLGDRVRRRENLRALLVQQQMIIAEMRPRTCPMKVLRLDVEGEHVRKSRVRDAERAQNGIVGEAGVVSSAAGAAALDPLLFISSISRILVAIEGRRARCRPPQTRRQRPTQFLVLDRKAWSSSVATNRPANAEGIERSS